MHRIVFLVILFAALPFSASLAATTGNDSPVNTAMRRLGNHAPSLRQTFDQQEKFCADLMNTLYQGKAKNFEATVSQYRSCYPYRVGYTPFSKDLIDEMMRLAFLADTSTNPAEAQQYLVDYKIFVQRHIGNIDVAEKAYALALQNPRYGNAVFHKKFYDTLKDLIRPKRPEHGQMPETAFRVFSFGEEDVILSFIGGKIVHSEIFELPDQTYNIHEIEDPKTGMTRKYFFNISLPLRIMKDREEVRKYEEVRSVPKL